MAVERHSRAPLRTRLLAVLVLASATTLGVSLFLACSPRGLAPSGAFAGVLQAVNLILSSSALTLALAVAWPLFQRRMRELDGMIVVCAWTRRVQWQGSWISFEEYLARRFNLRCTHGICDEAAAKMSAEAAKLGITRTP